MNNFTISVIVPVYNVEKYLNRCVDSIINQTHKNIEIILVDDGSTDNSSNLCDEYAKSDNRIKVIHTINSGVSNARNIGLDNATGDYVAFVDSDDWIDTKMYEKMIDRAINSNSDIVLCKYYTVYQDAHKEEDQKCLSSFIHDKNLYHYFTWDYSAFLMGNIWSAIINRNIISKLRFDKDIILREDLLFLLQILTKTKNIDFVDEFLYFYNMPINISISKYKMNRKYITSEVKYALSISNVLKNDGYFDLAESQIWYIFLELMTYLLIDFSFKDLSEYIKKYYKDIIKLNTYKAYKSYLKIYAKNESFSRKIKLFFLHYFTKLSIFLYKIKKRFTLLSKGKSI